MAKGRDKGRKEGKKKKGEFAAKKAANHERRRKAVETPIAKPKESSGN